MMRVTLLHMAITGSLLGVVTHLFVQSTSIAPEDHVRVLEIIDALNQSETDLRRNLQPASWIVLRPAEIHVYQSFSTGSC